MIIGLSLCLLTKFCPINISHDGPIWRIRWADLRHDYLLATAGFDGRVKFWLKSKMENESFDLLFTSENMEDSVNGIDFAPFQNELKLVAGSSNGNLMLISHRVRYCYLQF